jgi:hypothetical protein
MTRAVQHLLSLLATWRGRLILVVLVSQLLIPLHYYLPSQRDPHDERFAWRMFSPMRMTRCEVTTAKDDTPLDLGREFHEAWIEVARRGRFRVIEQMGQHLCAKYPGAHIKMALDCVYLNGKSERYGGYDMCEVPLL